jgi:mono/diheme cytochrome c family protein
MLKPKRNFGATPAGRSRAGWKTCPTAIEDTTMRMTVVLIWSAAVVRTAAGAEPAADGTQFFEKSIRPILVEHCQKCHGAKKQQGGLRLDSRDAALKGGDSGPAIVAGKPDESLVVRAVRHEDDDLKMPPEEKLSGREIADLVRWIEMGAPFPDQEQSGAARERDPNHWAFQPPIEPRLPEVGETAWPQSPIDRFILARLESQALRPAPKADKRTLIRRATFDLVGLPPTPEEIKRFLADDRPNAFARLVDRLLASAQYGERWGRHWLDVARYADSNGLDENVAHGNAWRYRDYVVRAFNDDKPFDRFVVEQLAGDLLPAGSEAQRHEQLIATGFLGIGPKVLAEVDEAKMQMDIVDEQIDTLGRAFLGMTLGCARCHDHKFDPIDTADYYALAGVFKSTRSMENYKKVARWYENVLSSPAVEATKKQYEERLTGKKEAVAAFIVRADDEVRKSASEDAKLPEKLESLYSEEAKAELKKLRDELAQLEKNPPELPSAMGATEDNVADVAICIRGNPLKLGEVVPRHVPAVIKGPAVPQFSASQSGRQELARWLVDPQHPLTSRVIVNRVWRWHFGKGLVRTTDNFGLLGEAPSHPELLDWLARRFVAGGWSIKSLHRLILLSATYQQSSAAGSETIARDPENRLFGRAEIRRLEAEEVRDALLAVGGRLDLTPGGSLLTVKNRAYFFDHTSKDLTDYTSRRRSIYLPVVRNNVYDLFQLLDYPDAATPSGDRPTTTVAPQALMMLNSDFVMEAAAGLAERLFCETASDDERIERLCAIAYGREATNDELTADRAFLSELDRSLVPREPDREKRIRQGWNVICHTIVATNEFIYVK